MACQQERSADQRWNVGITTCNTVSQLQNDHTNTDTNSCHQHVNW